MFEIEVPHLQYVEESKRFETLPDGTLGANLVARKS